MDMTATAAAIRTIDPAERPAMPEVSVVIPCLNEADTLLSCLAKAVRCLDDHGIDGEIIVADNGSTDGSREIAIATGVRLVDVHRRGYGSALMAGIAAARGRFIVMADADDSYDFGQLHRFVEKLRDGYDLVQGCRLPSGGGTVLPGAMPLLHRWWGNPMFSTLARRMFRTSVHDVYCGFRGFTRELYGRLGQRCTGMEFATEMIIQASLRNARTAEVPVTLHPDGRRSHAPHLRTFRDGWRTLRFYLIYCPRWLFLIPGVTLFLIGLLGYALAMPGVRIAGARLDAHTLLFASLFMLLGYQSVLFALLAKTFAIRERLVPEDPKLNRIAQIVTLERGLIAGAATFAAGGLLLLAAVHHWWLADFGNLNYAETMRYVVPGATLAALGFQTVLSSFFVSLLRVRSPLG
jgi:glycosyltransferase involved in cell wall biosynthesis